KYLTAANSIVSQAVPMVPRVIAETQIAGRRFHRAGAGDGQEEGEGPLSLSYYEPASVTRTFHAEHAGRYQLVLDLTAYERPAFVSDYNKCRLVFKADGQELLRQEYSRQNGKRFCYQLDIDWSAGDHELAFALEPLTPGERRLRSLAITIDSVTVRG